MLTKKRIEELASATIKEYGLLVAHALNEHCKRMDGHAPDAANLHVLLTIFAEKLEAEHSDVTAAIDSKLGIGWTRGLAEALK